jgi:peptidoglycan/LPS O-acetylase OafA/YrhL
LDLILLPFIGFLFASIRPSQNLEEGHLGKSATNNLKGISIIFIILHHINQELNGVSGTFFASRLTMAGRLGVAIFFFVSGYGIMRQYQIKGPSYLKNFLPHRLLPIILLYLLAMLLIFPIKHQLMGLTFSQAAISMTNGAPFVNDSWFVLAIIFFYFAFWLGMQISRGHSLPLFAILFLLTGLYTVYIWDKGMGEWLVNAAFVFPTGVLFAFYEDRFMPLIRRFYLPIMLGTLTAFALFFTLDEMHNQLRFRFFSEVFFALAVMMVSYRVEFSSKLFLISSAWSLNLYLYHPFIASWLHTIPAIGAHSVVYSIMVILLSYFVAGIIAYVQVTIKQLRSKRLASRSA